MQARTFALFTLAILAAISCHSLAQKCPAWRVKKCGNLQVERLIAQKKVCEAIVYKDGDLDLKACYIEECGKEFYEKRVKENGCEGEVARTCTDITMSDPSNCVSQSEEVKKLVEDKKYCDALEYKKDDVDVKACLIKMCSKEAYDKKLKELECADANSRSVLAEKCSDERVKKCRNLQVERLVAENKICEAIVYKEGDLDLKACYIEECGKKNYEKMVKENGCEGEEDANSSSVLALSSFVALISLFVNMI